LGPVGEGGACGEDAVSEVEWGGVELSGVRCRSTVVCLLVPYRVVVRDTYG